MKGCVGTSDANVREVQQWFAEHVTLDRQPYTLDVDQARAVSDLHKNTLVTARAGSGKTRVIVAKVTYLVACCGLSLDQIAIFMFNRSAAAEVNQRIAAVQVDGRVLPSLSSENRVGKPEKHNEELENYPQVAKSLTGEPENLTPNFADHASHVENLTLSPRSYAQDAEKNTTEPKDHTIAPEEHTPSSEKLTPYLGNLTSAPVQVASTFHKYALGIVKLAREHPEIISEAEQMQIIQDALRASLERHQHKANRDECAELLSIVKGFIARAGQKYPGMLALPKLRTEVNESCQKLQAAHDEQKIFYHTIALEVYEAYLQALQSSPVQQQSEQNIKRNGQNNSGDQNHQSGQNTTSQNAQQNPRCDFNLLMARATELLTATRRDLERTTQKKSEQNITRVTRRSTKQHIEPHKEQSLKSNRITGVNQAIYQKVQRLRYIMIDEYQDFSYLFYALTQAIRALAPAAHLFAVGDDWQAINRFAGSDVNYFINFAEYFPEDIINIPLATNYRSDRRIVENANRYMLKYYDPQALPAQAFSRHAGKIKYLNPAKQKFDTNDILEDGLGDARFQLALETAVQTSCTAQTSQIPPISPTLQVSQATQIPRVNFTVGAYQLIKQLYRLCQKHRHKQIMLLHRHNFTSFHGLTLENLTSALKILLANENILPAEDFDKQVRCMTMHKSKGLESDIVILLEVNREIVQSEHPHAAIFEIFGDTRTAERADQQRLIYVALTRAKHRLYILSTDDRPPVK